jgi:polar amino acid transport system substrate-binding protein
LGQRLNVPVEIVPYPNPGALADAAKSGVWDLGFLGAEPQRANEIDFTAAYVEIEATYLVQPGSRLRSIGEVDREGMRIAVPTQSAYELYLTRSLKHASLVHEKGADNAFNRFVEDRLDALAGLKPRLVADHDKLPGSRLLDGRFTAVQQAVGTPKGRRSGAQYLREFVEDIKTTGLVARTIDKNGVRGPDGGCRRTLTSGDPTPYMLIISAALRRPCMRAQAATRETRVSCVQGRNGSAQRRGSRTSPW